MSYLFTSESVSEGHPDKVADAISDAILDLVMAKEDKTRHYDVPVRPWLQLTVLSSQVNSRAT